MFSHVYMFHQLWCDDAKSKLFGPHVLFSNLFFHILPLQGERPSIAIHRSDIEVNIMLYIYFFCITCCSWRVYFFAPNVYSSKKWHIAVRCGMPRYCTSNCWHNILVKNLIVWLRNDKHDYLYIYIYIASLIKDNKESTLYLYLARLTNKNITLYTRTAHLWLNSRG